MSEEGGIEDYRDLLVWRKAIALTKLVYAITSSVPQDERFGLVTQMRRAAVSVAANIAEGQARHTTGEFIQFISHAEGSVAELDTHFTIAIELQYCSPREAEKSVALISELRKMLNGLRRKLVARR